MTENEDPPREGQAAAEEPAANLVPSPLNGVVPPVDHRWKPGQSGNPAGRKTAGAVLRDWLNALGEKELPEAELRAIGRDKAAPWAKRAAAKRLLRTMESGDLADMEGLLDGRMSLEQLRESGVDTEVIRRIKVKRRKLFDN